MKQVSVPQLIIGSLFPLGLPAVRAAEPSCPDSSFGVLEERQLTTNTADHLNPAISGDYVAYTDRRGVTADIYLFNLTTNEEILITPAPARTFPGIIRRPR